MKLTKSALATLTTDKPDHVFWDDAVRGLGVRVRGTAKRWIIQYRLLGRQRRESIGDVSRITLEGARRVARERFARIALGYDPAVEKAKAKAAAAAARLTLGAVSEAYLDAKRGVLRPSSYGDAARYFTKHWQPLRDCPIETVTRATVAARLQEIARQNGRTAAARARSHLSGLYVWAMKEGLCSAVNPVSLTNDPSVGLKSRTRVLADPELRVLWNGCEDDDFGRIVRLLILTGCRRREIGALKWSELDFDTGVMTISAERTKHARVHELALPPITLDILRAAPHRRDYVFGERGAGFSSWSTATAALRRRLSEPLPAWTLHDIRRTFRTGLSRLGVLPHVSELAIGHVRGGVEAIYDRHRYTREVASALALWAEHVTAVVENRPRKVLPLVRA